MLPTAPELPVWPRDAAVAVCWTVDVDADVASAGAIEGAHGRTTISHGRFGIMRGLPRLLGLLDRFEIPATFYVPGWVALHYRAQLTALSDGAHEVGHHGFLHLRPDQCSPALQRDEIERGIAALTELCGTQPRGYRSPSWELTNETLEILLEHGFSYDSSCMGDDRPYFEMLRERRLLEFPVHWSLDDWPYFSFTGGPEGTLSDVDAWRRSWLLEIEQAVSERRVVTLTLHPEVIGRGYRIAALEQLIGEIREREDVWFARHGDIASIVQQAPGYSESLLTGAPRPPARSDGS